MPIQNIKYQSVIPIQNDATKVYIKDKLPTLVDKTYMNVLPKEFTQKYINSNAYRDRLKKSGYENIDNEIKARNKEVSESRTITQKDSPGLIQQIKNELKGTEYSINGSSAAYPKIVIVDKQQAKDLKTPYPLIEAHEYSHKETGIRSDGLRLNNYDQMQLIKRLKNGYDPTLHDLKPTENKSDMNMLRYDLYRKGKDVLNKDIKPEDIKDIDKQIPYQRLLNNYKKEDLLWLLNNIADNKSKDSIYTNKLV